MITMLISDTPDAERRRILEAARSQAARYTDERWTWRECGSVQELQTAVSQDNKVNIMCLDITMKDTDRILEIAAGVRSRDPQLYMILVADASISPVRYMRPAIGAQSLMLKPLTDNSVTQILSEAVRTYARKYLDPDAGKMFLLESRGEKQLIPYESILYFESREKKVFLNTGENEYGFYDTLDSLSKQLGTRFLRCHRSFLINTGLIRQIQLSQNRILLQDGTEVPVSRTCKGAVRKYLEEAANGQPCRKPGAAAVL